jgi:rsbT co-antagonist protein RsbR
LVCIVRDVTEQKQAEAERIRLQNEIIQGQAAMLAELSTPLIPIDDNVMVMPLIGTLDSRRAQQIVDTLLAGIAESHTQVAILDITGVPIVDTQVANALIRAAQSVKLLGAQVVLTGIRPEVAQTLVGLGADLSGLVTRSSLQSGIAYAMTRQ